MKDCKEEKLIGNRFSCFVARKIGEMSLCNDDERSNNAINNLGVVESKKAAFTLAEVLITIGIIGVVAAMTLPSLIQKHKEKATVTKLKKVYSTLSNAYSLALNEHGNVTYWLIGSDKRENAEIFFNNLKPYLNVSKQCGGNEGCLTTGFVKTLDGRNYLEYDKFTTEYRFVLSDGTQVMFYVPRLDTVATGISIGNIKVDIDGYRGPYTIGKDFFIFDIFSDRILPAGTPVSAEQDDSLEFTNSCNMSKKTYANGYSCTAWVIYNENMDYLHCDDLNWTGKKKCSDK